MITKLPCYILCKKITLRLMSLSGKIVKPNWKHSAYNKSLINHIIRTLLSLKSTISKSTISISTISKLFITFYQGGL